MCGRARSPPGEAAERRRGAGPRTPRRPSPASGVAAVGVVPAVLGLGSRRDRRHAATAGPHPDASGCANPRWPRRNAFAGIAGHSADKDAAKPGIDQQKRCEEGAADGKPGLGSRSARRRTGRLEATGCPLRSADACQAPWYSRDMIDDTHDKALPSLRVVIENSLGLRTRDRPRPLPRAWSECCLSPLDNPHCAVAN